MQKTVRIDGLGRLLGHLVVALHDVVALAAQFPVLPRRADVAVVHVQHAHFHRGVRPAHGLALVGDVVVHGGLGEHRARLRKAVADGHVPHVHALHDLAHGLGRARAAGHDARAQMRQVEGVEVRVVQLGDEHGGHAVDRRRLLLVEGLKHQLGVELLHDEHGAAVGEAGHDPQHAAEAVEERHRQAHTVFGTELLSLADVEAVVQNVAMGEHDALGEARGAARVLHHDHVVVVELALGPFQGAVRLVLAEQQKFRHAVEAAVLLGPHVDEVLEEGVLLGMEEAALHVQRLGHQIADDLQVVHIAVGIDHAERLHVRLLQHVVELVGLVHRVHRDHDHADLRGGVHEGEPVGDVARPHAQMIARLHADGQEALGQSIGSLVEVLVGPAQVAIGVHDELVIGIDRHLLLQVGADGQLRVQRIIGRPGNGSVGRLVLFRHRSLPGLERRVNTGQEFSILSIVRSYLVGHDGIVVDGLAGAEHVGLVAVLDLDLPLP